MKHEEIVSFVRSNAEELPAVDPYGVRYRVSATLTDGVALPCVVIEPAKNVIDLAVRRFDEEKKGGLRAVLGRASGYRMLVETFVTRGNRVNHYDLQSLSKSRYAIPLARLREIRGETSMGWTEFYATMADRAEFRFGTTFYTEFFDMPPGYSATDIQKIVPAVRGETPRQERIFREKPFFTCFVDGL